MNLYAVLISLLLFSTTAFAASNFSSQSDVTPLVQNQHDLSEIAKRPAQLYTICISEKVCASVYAGLDAENKICAFKLVRWL